MSRVRELLFRELDRFPVVIPGHKHLREIPPNVLQHGIEARMGKYEDNEVVVSFSLLRCSRSADVGRKTIQLPSPGT
jgi:hypothetical protein